MKTTFQMVLKEPLTQIFWVFIEFRPVLSTDWPVCCLAHYLSSCHSKISQVLSEKQITFSLCTDNRIISRCSWIWFPLWPFQGVPNVSPCDRWNRPQPPPLHPWIGWVVKKINGKIIFPGFWCFENTCMCFHIVPSHFAHLHVNLIFHK